MLGLEGNHRLGTMVFGRLMLLHRLGLEGNHRLGTIDLRKNHIFPRVFNSGILKKHELDRRIFWFFSFFSKKNLHFFKLGIRNR